MGRGARDSGPRYRTTGIVDLVWGGALGIPVQCQILRESSTSCGAGRWGFRSTVKDCGNLRPRVGRGARDSSPRSRTTGIFDLVWDGDRNPEHPAPHEAEYSRSLLPSTGIPSAPKIPVVLYRGQEYRAPRPTRVVIMVAKMKRHRGAQNEGPGHTHSWLQFWAHAKLRWFSLFSCETFLDFKFGHTMLFFRAHHVLISGTHSGTHSGHSFRAHWRALISVTFRACRNYRITQMSRGGGDLPQVSSICKLKLIPIRVRIPTLILVLLLIMVLVLIRIIRIRIPTLILILVPIQYEYQMQGTFRALHKYRITLIPRGRR